MPIEEPDVYEFSTQDKALFVTCGALVVSYIGFVLYERRRLRKAEEHTNKMYQETSEKIAEIIDIEKHRLTDN